MQTKAFAYLRVSGKGQLDGDGFPRQIATISKYAAGAGIEIVRIFREKAVPGATELSNRPAFLELLQALAADGIKMVLIEKLDRLARDLMVQETIIGDLQKKGFQLISAHEPDLLSNDPTRKLMRQVMGAIAEYDKAMIVAKLRGARERMRFSRGYCEGRKAYGQDDHEKGVLQQIQQLRGAGMAVDKIAAKLNAEGVPTRTAGRQWHGATVNRILKASA